VAERSVTMVKGKPVLPSIGAKIETLVTLGYKPKDVIKHVWKRYRGKKLRNTRPSKSWIYEKCASFKGRSAGRPKTTRQNPGRKRILTDEELKYVIDLIRNKEANTSPQIRYRLSADRGVHVSVRTIRRQLAMQQWISRAFPYKKMVLTEGITPELCAKNVQFYV
jgi:transposase